MIGGVAPSHYLEKLQHHKQVKLDDGGMDAILKSHLISPADLRNDDFHAFYKARKQAMLALIESAMGKTIVVGAITEESEEEAGRADNSASQETGEEVGICC